MPVSTGDFAYGDDGNKGVAVSSFQSSWVDLIEAGGMDDTDTLVSGSIVNPASGITDSSRFLRDIPNKGTTLVLRMAYDDAIVFSTAPVIQVFGVDDLENYIKLFNENGVHEITMSAAPSTDVTDGTDKFTDTNKTDGTYFVDMLGCDKILVGVKTAAAVSSGSAALISLQGKVI